MLARRLALAAAVLALVVPAAAKAAAPTAATGTPGRVTDTTVVLKGTVTPNGQPTQWYFEYGTSPSYGSKTSVQAAGSGSAPVDVSAIVTGLTAGTQYHYRVTATNAAGTVSGDDATFTTASAPSATTGTGTAQGGVTITLTGTVDPHLESTQWYFDYGASTAYGSRSSGGTVPEGSGGVPVTTTVTGLKPSTTYHFRLVATNAAGSAQGDDRTVTTAPPPALRTGPVTALEPTSATVAGTVDPNGTATTWYVEYGPTTAYGARSAPTDAGGGNGARKVTVTLTGLTPGTRYHYRLAAEGPAGTIAANDAVLTTLAPPTAVTGAAIHVSQATASLRGIVVPKRSATTWYFQYGTSTSYGQRTIARRAGSGIRAIHVVARPAKLAPGTVYHYRLVATNRAGITYGADRQFTSLAQPVVRTGPASGVTRTRATVTGSVDPRGRPTTAWFEYGATTRYGARTAARRLGSTPGDHDVSSVLARLAPGKRYHYRLVAKNVAGTTRGGDQTFTTGP